MLPKKRRKEIRRMSAGQMCRFCQKAVADHWLGTSMCETARAIYLELKQKRLGSGALYSAFVKAIRAGAIVERTDG